MIVRRAELSDIPAVAALERGNGGNVGKLRSANDHVPCASAQFLPQPASAVSGTV